MALGLGIQFNTLGGIASKVLIWGRSIPARFWGTESPEYWGGIDAQAQVHYNRVIADGGVVPAGLGGVNSFFQVVKGVYGTSDINTAISAAYDAHYLGYKLGAGSGTTLGQAAQKLYAPKGIFGGIGTGSAFYDSVGVTGNFINTPSIGIDTNSGMSVDVKVALVSGVTYTSNWICSNDNGSTNRNMFLGFTSPNRTLIVYWSNLTRFASSTIALSDGFDGWIRCSLETSGSDMLVRFFTSLDGITYTQLGATVTNSGGANTFQTSNAPFNITGNGGANIVTGKIYRVIYRNASGVVRADFNANQYTGANTWTSTTSEVWTVNSTGAGLADVTQTTAASQPLLLEHSGENYWFGSGVSGNYCNSSTINSSYTAIECKGFVNHYNSTSTDSSTIISHGNVIFQIYNNTGTQCSLVISWYDGGSVSRFRTSSQFNQSLLTTNPYIKATVEQVGADQIAKFYYSPDGVNYALISTAAGITTTGFQTQNTTGVAGAYLAGSGASKIKIYRATISNSIGGTPVVDFNPASYNAATSQTQWSSATGEVWSLNVGTATSGYKGAVITKSIVMSDGVDDRMITSASRANVNTQYISFNALSSDGSGDKIIIDSTSATYRNSIAQVNNDIYLWMNNAASSVIVAKTLRRLGLITTTNNAGVKNSISSNNGTEVSNTYTPTPSGTGISLFSRSDGGAGSFSNSLFTTYLVSNIQDNSTQRTATYNYLRSINDNAY